jgi:hypothetical protein
MTQCGVVTKKRPACLERLDRDGMCPVHCRAKRRDGTPCGNNHVKGRHRCRMHGGKSRWWVAHPNYKHGRYSKFALAAREEAEARRRRKRQRTTRAVLRKLDAWLAGRGGECAACEWWAAVRRIRREHDAALAARRSDYRLKKSPPRVT